MEPGREFHCGLRYCLNQWDGTHSKELICKNHIGSPAVSPTPESTLNVQRNAGNNVVVGHTQGPFLALTTNPKSPDAS